MRKATVAVLALTAGGMLYAAPLSAAEEHGIQAGGATITPAIQIDEKHDDNIWLQELNKKSSWITTITPSIQAELGKGSSTFDLAYTLDKGFYHSSSADNYLDHTVTAGAKMQPSARLDGELNASYLKAHDARGATFTGLGLITPTPNLYHETTVDGRIGYGTNAHIDLSGAYSNKVYDNNRAQTIGWDVDTMSGDAKFSYLVAPKTRAVLEARYEVWNYKLAGASTLDSRQQSYLGGLEWKATARTTGSVLLGYRKKSFADPARADASSFDWEASVKWLPKSYSLWTLDTSRQNDESDGQGNFVRTSGGFVMWEHGYSSRLHHMLKIDYRKRDYQGLNRKDDIVTGEARIDYDLNAWLNAGLAYNYANRNSNAALASYRQNIWMLELIGSL